MENKITYVIYDEDGNLQGYYIQVLRPEHESAYIQIAPDSPCTNMTWFNYRANAARDGVELIPPPEPDPE